MKTTGFRSFVLYILLFAFCGGFVWFLINLALNGSTWATQPYNGHIYGDDTAVSAGTITDRSGMVLAKTEDGSRVYAESEDIRRALLHTVGDSSGYIGTAVQAVHRSQLVGYNPITGLARTVLSDLGNNLVLTVDANASAAAYNAFNGRNGSAFVYNYKTGEVLVKVSAPTYDPMNVPEDLNDNEEYNGVFLDHTLSSTYTPGSIFKLVTAAAAMEYLPDWDTRTYTCEEEMDIGSGKVTCLNYHGELNLEQALGYSCNLYFAQLAEDIGAENLKKKAEEMGFGKNFSFDSVTTDQKQYQFKQLHQRHRPRVELRRSGGCHGKPVPHGAFDGRHRKRRLHTGAIPHGRQKPHELHLNGQLHCRFSPQHDAQQRRQLLRRVSFRRLFAVCQNRHRRARR